MKILMVNKFLAENGGSERYMIDLGQALCAMGHTVEYFGMDQPDKAAGNSFGIYTKNVDYHTDSRKEKSPLRSVQFILLKPGRKCLRFLRGLNRTPCI